MEDNPYRSPAPDFSRKPPASSLRSFRLARDFPYAAEYGPAIWTAVKVQVACLALSALLLDRGEGSRAALAAITMHWAAVTVVLYRSPRQASPFGLALIRYGAAILVAASVVLLPMLLRVFAMPIALPFAK